MRLVRIGVASVNSTVGAVRSNTDKCIELAHRMAGDDVTLAVFPEQVIGGYAAEDLVQWRGFVASQRREVERFARETSALETAFAIGLTIGIGGDLFNVAALVFRGRIVAFCPKEKLPADNVFYESRTHSRGMAGMRLDAGGGIACGDGIFSFSFGVVALEVCEDIWSPDGPMRRRAFSGAEIVCNLSASPFRAGIPNTRREMIATRAADNQVIVAYANLVGGNDGLVFDGGGFINQNGRPILDAERFREGFSAATIDLDRTTRSRTEASTWRCDLEEFRRRKDVVPLLAIGGEQPHRERLRFSGPLPTTTFFLPTNVAQKVSPRDEFLDDLFEVLSVGVADYFVKTGCFERIGLALSGGRDSLLSLLVAWRAVQRIDSLRVRAIDDSKGESSAREAMKRRLYAFYMPSKFSSAATGRAAAKIAEELGANFMVVPIEEAHEREFESTRTMLSGDKLEITELTNQNIQARIRGARMWNWANSSGALFLQTGNMSEKAVGYTTVGGDLEGAFSVIANLPKTVVMAMLSRLQERFQFEGIRMTLETVPGPELAAGQVGENELMPFEVLDACLHLYGAEKLAEDEVALALCSLFPEESSVRLAEWAAKFARLFTRSIFKWVQAPLAVHVGSLDLDRERALQLPVVQKTEWSGMPPAKR